MRILELRAEAQASEKARLEHDLSFANTELSNLRDTAARHRERTIALEGDIASLQESLDHERQRIGAIHGHIHTATKSALSELFSIEDSHETQLLRERVKALEKEISSLIHLPKDLGVRQADMQAELSKAKDRIKSLERSLKESGGSDHHHHHHNEETKASDIARLEADLNAQRDKFHQLHLKFFEVSDELNLSKRNCKLLEQDIATMEKAQADMFAFQREEGRRLALQGSQVQG